MAFNDEEKRTVDELLIRRKGKRRCRGKPSKRRDRDDTKYDTE